MEKVTFSWEKQVQMAMFHSCAKLPEDISVAIHPQGVRPPMFVAINRGVSQKMINTEW